MTGKKETSSNTREGRRPAFWRSSTYEEPTWVSLAWIIGPILLAGSLIYAVLQ